MAMTAASMATFVKAAMTASGKTFTPGQFEALTELCQGIIQEIQTNGVVAVTTPGATAGPATLPGTGSLT